jgi:hypothetical protein
MISDVAVPSLVVPNSAPSASGSQRRAGKLRTGVVAGNSGLGSKSSIPTRFETILHKDNHEANAFGRRTYRFDEPENMLPGPGAYEKSRSIIKQSGVCVSKRGSSGFAAPVGLSGGGIRKTPGPGAYSPECFPSTSTATHTSPTKPSPAFVGPSPKPVLHLARPAAEPLGPGQYFTDQDRSTLTAPCAAVMNHTTTKPRVSVFAQPTNVGPGQYEVQGYLGVGVKDPLQPSYFSLSGTSRFGLPKSHQDAMQRTLATNLPPLLASSCDVDRLGVPHVVREVQEKKWSDSGARAHSSSQSSNKSSSMFFETNLDRFGRPIVRFTAPESDALGPGRREATAHAHFELMGTVRNKTRCRQGSVPAARTCVLLSATDCLQGLSSGFGPIRVCRIAHIR